MGKFICNWWLFGVKIFISSVLIFSGIAKIVDSTPLVFTITELNVFNESLVIFIATLLPIIEIVLALFLIMNIYPKWTIAGIVFLFFTFLCFSIYGTIVELNNDCGCFGSFVSSEIGWEMVIRNSMFLLISLLLIKEKVREI